MLTSAIYWAYILCTITSKCMAGDVYSLWNNITPVLISLHFTSKTMALSSSIKAHRDIECYDCLTYQDNSYCADPFNRTNKLLKTVMCDGYCAKWVRQIRPGVTRVTRTCSSHLKIDMTIHLVCMEESRPGTGHICFCNKPRCNRVSAQNTSSIFLLLLSLFSTMFSLQPE